MPQLIEVLAPLVEPLSVALTKLHTRVDENAEDELIAAHIASAREQVEGRVRRMIVARRFDYLLDGFAPCIHLPVAPVRAVESISYVDTAGAVQTLAAADYVAEVREQPCRIIAAPGTVWPPTDARPGAVRVRFVAGYCVPFTADATSNVITADGHGLTDTAPVQVWGHSGALASPLIARAAYYVRDVSGQTLRLAASSGGSAIDLTSAGAGAQFIGVYPEPLRVAMLLLVAHWYENRMAVTDRAMFEVPQAVDAVLGPLRLPTY